MPKLYSLFFTLKVTNNDIVYIASYLPVIHLAT